MTFSVLMDLASQREEQLSARARLPRPDAIPGAAAARRTGKRGRRTSHTSPSYGR
jgi:hypothetical protein